MELANLGNMRSDVPCVENIVTNQLEPVLAEVSVAQLDQRNDDPANPRPNSFKVPFSASNAAVDCDGVGDGGRRRAAAAARHAGRRA